MYVYQKTCTKLFMAALFKLEKIAPNWKTPICPSTVERVNELWHIHTMGKFTATRIKELQLHQQHE